MSKSKKDNAKRSLKAYKKTKSAKSDSQPVNGERKTDRGGERGGEAKKSSKKLYTGLFELKSSGNGWVICQQMDTDIFIPRIYTKNAQDGDTVEVELIATPKLKEVEGKVLRVITRNRTEFVGELKKTFHGSVVVTESGLKIKPSNLKIARYSELKPETMVVIKIDDWKDPLRGEIIEVLGDKNEPHISLMVIARKFGFYDKFPDAALSELEAFDQGYIDRLKIGREDLSKEPIFTVDPTDAKDFDDAINIKKHADGGYSLGVHIADVSAFIPEGSALDEEAAKRATSLYLPSSVIPMLPKKLSNLLCSLNPDIERLAMSCFMEFTADGTVTKFNFKESVIKSAMRYDYKIFQEQLDKVVNGEEPDEKYASFKEILLWSKELKDILRKKRSAEGSIEFDLPEIKIAVDENGKAIDIHPYEIRESNHIIEEFMLAANRCAAEYLEKRSGKLPAVFRIHDKPSEEKMHKFFRELELNKIKIKAEGDITKHKFVQDLLLKIKKNDNGDYLMSGFLRSMMKAKYSTSNIGHYGLAFDLYTHFTSPIRRYPDLMVHRLIKKHLHTLSVNPKYDSPKEIEHRCQVSTMREIQAIKAEYEANDLKIAEFMSDKIGNAYSGVVISLSPFGAYVRLREIPIEGMLHIKKQTDDMYEYLEERSIIKGKRTGLELFVGKNVDIILQSVDRELQLIDFVLNKKCDDNKKMSPNPQSEQKEQTEN